MNHTNRSMMVFGAILVLVGCKKLDTPVADVGTVNVTNAVVGASTITLISKSSIISGSNNTIASNASTLMSILNNETQLTLGIPAISATATTPAVPAVIYYDQPITKNGIINQSLFLTGSSPSAVESVLINETFPYSYSDSSCGVRFINLAQGNTAVSVNLKNSPTGSEASGIAYKGYSEFKKYAATRSTPSYIFEFRKIDGTLITSYTLTTPYFHNVTLALRGTIGGSTGVILVNNY